MAEMRASDDETLASDLALENYLEAALTFPRAKLMREARAGSSGQHDPYKAGFDAAKAHYERQARLAGSAYRVMRRLEEAAA